MNSSRRFGLAGLILASFVAVSSGCDSKDKTFVTLPNGYSIEGTTWKSKANKENTNIYSSKREIVEKSRITGAVELIRNGIVKLNTDIQGYANSGVKEYTLDLRAKDISKFAESPELFKEGDLVSFPTIREYDEQLGEVHAYRILNPVDYIYLEEIEKVSPTKPAK
jgi:hypothetical protein